MSKATVKKKIAAIVDYKSTFKSQHGKRVLHDLMKNFGVLSKCFVSGDSHGTAFNEGQRYVVLHILRNIKMDEELFGQAIDEMKQEEEYNATLDI